jgi:hypothetical protein
MSEQGMIGMDLAAQEVLGVGEPSPRSNGNCRAARKDGR